MLYYTMMVDKEFCKATDNGRSIVGREEKSMPMVSAYPVRTKCSSFHDRSGNVISPPSGIWLIVPREW